ncbi:MAG: hypothetical protein OXT67_09640 [Zetaproteobacteria bacterium]|nr:hypothetical protein [Zetaproteobacteria bacterium]
MFEKKAQAAPARYSCLVVGHGAVGVAVAARLQICGLRPFFWGRSGPVLDSFQFQGWGRQTKLDPVTAPYTLMDQLKIVFVAVKAFQLNNAVSRVIALVPKGIPIVCLSNGNVEPLLRAFVQAYPDHLWRMGICRAGVSEVYPKCYGLKSTSGQVLWGNLVSSSALSARQQPVEMEEYIFSQDQEIFLGWKENILVEVRKKWLFNCIMNSLCAAYMFPSNGHLLENIKQVEAVHLEAYRLGAEMWGDWPVSFSVSDSYHELIKIICATSENENSMHRDVRLGRKTENQYLAQIATRYRGYPLLKNLSRLIDEKALESTPHGKPA